jgi:hypothetical protein
MAGSARRSHRMLRSPCCSRSSARVAQRLQATKPPSRAGLIPASGARARVRSGNASLGSLQVTFLATTQGFTNQQEGAATCIKTSMTFMD